MTLDDGRVQPEFTLHPLLDIAPRERPDPIRDLLTERVLREFEQERMFGQFLGHVVGRGACPHKVRRFLWFASACVPSSVNRAFRTRRSEAWRACRFPSRSSRCARAIGLGTRDFSPSTRWKSARSDWPAVFRSPRGRIRELILRTRRHEGYL